MADLSPRLIVVFDSNIWLAELGLRSAAGAATRFFLNHYEAQLAIPEVVRREVQQKLRMLLSGHLDTIRSSHRQLLAVFGSLKELVLPTPAELDAKIDELFSALEVATRDVPFTFETAKSALDKTISKTPPCDKSQEFKDAAIWADCLSLLAEAPLILVTEDKAFYQDRDYRKGLANSLAVEAASYRHPLTLLPHLTDLLQRIRAPIALNEDHLAQSFLEAQNETVSRMLEASGFELGERQSLSYNLFATENTSQLFLTFEIVYSCHDLRNGERVNGILELKGDGQYNPQTYTYSSLRGHSLKLSCQLADGSRQEITNVVSMAAHIVLGHRDVWRTTRYPLTGEE
jgi:hypothetical protein